MSEPLIVVEGSLYSSKNSRRIVSNKGKTKNARPFYLLKSQQALTADTSIIFQLNRQREIWQDMFNRHLEFCNDNDLPVYPLRIKFHIYRQNKVRFDFVNVVQSILDMLVKAEYIEDDNANIVLPVFTPYLIDKERPRTELYIERPIYD